jgi:hypothetical protein
MIFHENWNLICKLHKHFNSMEKDKSSSSGIGLSKELTKEHWFTPSMLKSVS